MKAFLKRLLCGPPQQSIDHPAFGKALLIKTKTGAYWEAEAPLQGRTIGVAIECIDDMSPTDAQVAFYRSIVEDQDAAFRKAEPKLRPEFEQWVRACLKTLD
jgi:hypothetical protein